MTIVELVRKSAENRATNPNRLSGGSPEGTDFGDRRGAKQPPSGDVMTMCEVATYLQVHHSIIYRLLRRGVLPVFKVGADWRFSREAIDRWRIAAEQESKQ